MECHAFRKFFETTVKTAGIDTLYLKRLMGQKTGLEDSYFKPSEEQILEGNDRMSGFIAAIDDLTINEENRLKRKVETLQVRADKIDELAQTLEECKARIGMK